MAHFHLHRYRSSWSRNFLQLSTALLLGTALLTTGCHQAVTDPKDPKFIVAEKGTWMLTRADLDKEISAFLKQRHATPEQIGPAKMSVLETAVLDSMVMKKLMMDRAAQLQLKDVDKEEADAFGKLKGRFPTDKEFQDQLQSAGLTEEELKQRIHEEVLIHKVIEADVAQDAEPTEQEINDFYLKNKDKFVKPPQVRASRILIMVDDKTSPTDKAAKKKAIDKARARVVKGEDFAKVASEVSEDRYSAPRGGDIGEFRNGENEPQFDQVAFGTKVGDVSAVFQTPMGYQFLKVTDSQPGGDVPLAEVRASISSYLRKMKMSGAEEAYTKKLLDNSGVIFHLVRVDLTKPVPPPSGAPVPPAAPAPAPASTDAAPVPTPAPAK